MYTINDLYTLEETYPEAKAYFRVSEMLGNDDAFQNFLAIHG